ncbi:hypothetical protein B0H34DRAFT_728114 [Crassisporium funariophilum]|nr:hypothetical protein B0H34DRAFT_728114 [Crassisporium funariophilum]
MLFNLSKVFVALATVTAVAASPAKRQLDAVTCDFVLSPDVTVDPTTTNLEAEFNYAIVRSVAMATGANSVFNYGSSFVDNADGTFNVKNTVSADGFTAAQTAETITGFAGTTLEGQPPTVVNWLVESVVCA